MAVLACLVRVLPVRQPQRSGLAASACRWPGRPGRAAASLVAGGLGAGGAAPARRRLAWDGEPGPWTAGRALAVMLDLGGWMLLRCVTGRAPAPWLPLSGAGRRPPGRLLLGGACSSRMPGAPAGNAMP
jgi:hypothetical protein